jgi:hypothetical protein
MSDDLGWFAGIIAVCVVFGVVYAIGYAGGKAEMQDEAVKIGYAEYYLDAEHNKQWRWKPKGEEDGKAASRTDKVASK